MKKLFSIAIVFIFAALIFTGCKKESKDNSSLMLLALLSQSNTSSGTPESVAAGGQVASSVGTVTSAATSSALMAAMTGSTSSIAENSMNALAKESMQQSITDVLAKKAIEAGEKKAATTELNITLTTPSTAVPGLSIEPNLTLKGTVTGEKVSTTENKYEMSYTLSGSIKATFTNYTVKVFDVYNFIKNNTIQFNTITLTGTVDTTVNQTSSVNMTMATVSSSASEIVTNVTSSTKSDGSATATSSSLSIAVDGGTAATHAFDIKSTEKGDTTVAMTMTMALPSYSSSLTVNSATGSTTWTMTGTVDGSAASYSYTVSAAKLLEYYKALYATN